MKEEICCELVVVPQNKTMLALAVVVVVMIMMMTTRRTINYTLGARTDRRLIDTHMHSTVPTDVLTAGQFEFCAVKQTTLTGFNCSTTSLSR